MSFYLRAIHCIILEYEVSSLINKNYEKQDLMLFNYLEHLSRFNFFITKNKDCITDKL